MYWKVLAVKGGLSINTQGDDKCTWLTQKESPQQALELFFIHIAHRTHTHICSITGAHTYPSSSRPPHLYHIKTFSPHKRDFPPWNSSWQGCKDDGYRTILLYISRGHHITWYFDCYYYWVTNKLSPCAHNIPQRPLHTHSAWQIIQRMHILDLVHLELAWRYATVRHGRCKEATCSINSRLEYRRWAVSPYRHQGYIIQMMKSTSLSLHILMIDDSMNEETADMITCRLSALIERMGSLILT